MKPRAILACALVLAAACAGGPHPATPATGAAAASSQEVVAGAKATIEQWRQAYEVRSVDALAKLYAHDLDVVVVQQGVPHLGWTAVQALLDERIGHASAIHVRLKDVQVTALAPTVAAAVATMSREVSDGATTVTETGTLTLVVRKTDAGWVITSEHYSYKR